MYCYTLLATTVSRRENRCTQILPPTFETCSFPIKLKSKIHEAFHFLFQLDRVPPAIIFCIAKEMILSEFNRKLKEAICHLKTD